MFIVIDQKKRSFVALKEDQRARYGEAKEMSGCLVDADVEWLACE